MVLCYLDSQVTSWSLPRKSLIAVAVAGPRQIPPLRDPSLGCPDLYLPHFQKHRRKPKQGWLPCSAPEKRVSVFLGNSIICLPFR